MRLDHLLSKERRSREVGICCLVIKEWRRSESEAEANDNFIFPVAMRSGDTPVPIPNTMVKT